MSPICTSVTIVIILLMIIYYFFNTHTQVPFDSDSFSLLVERGKKHEKGTQGSRATYTISHFKNLEDLLGKQWHLRILNDKGDYCYVMLHTISFYLSKGQSIKEYGVNINGGGTYSFQETFLEQNTFLVFCFVWGDSIKSQLVNFL